MWHVNFFLATLLGFGLLYYHSKCRQRTTLLAHFQHVAQGY